VTELLPAAAAEVSLLEVYQGRAPALAIIFV